MISLLAPLIATLATAVLAPAVARRLRPAHGARLLCLSIAALIIASWATASTLALAYLTHLPWSEGPLRWCHHALGDHESPSNPVGVAALMATATLTWRISIVARAWHQTRGQATDEVHIISSERAVAFAEPGRHGGVVITTTMLDILAPTERQALLAHERAHLRHRHDRYLAVAAVIGAIPALRSLGSQLRALLERWADEDAAHALGDRTIVASAIARAALHTPTNPPPALAATGGDVPSRVRALLEPPPTTALAVLIGVATAAAVATSTLTQLHHLIALVEALCRH